MLLRAAIVFLLVLNLGIAAWWISGGNARPQQAAPAPAGVPGLRLVAETATAAAVTTAPQAPPAIPAQTQVPDVASTVEQCLRFGPFADAAARDAARSALSAAGLAAMPRDTPARASRGWKVYIPAFASRDEAKAMGERIKAAGVSDWYVMNEGGDAHSIALGRYGGEEAARRRQAELKAKGIDAQAEALGDSAAQAWLDARLPANVRRASLAAIASAKNLDCATLR
ncbi:MAG: SPOR domain-containing protein [Lysobacteraceae bacterium]|nr:MAG: SPOR domain-containing protein [Xanthomonadaceae bacterium]